MKNWQHGNRLATEIACNIIACCHVASVAKEKRTPCEKHVRHTVVGPRTTRTRFCHGALKKLATLATWQQCPRLYGKSVASGFCELATVATAREVCT